MASITLYDLSHFIEEITASRRLVEHGVVRLHTIENEGFWSSSVRRAHVVATARIGQDLIRLDMFYGPPSSQDAFDREVVRPMARDLHQLHETCHVCGLDIRQGVLEEALVRQ